MTSSFSPVTPWNKPPFSFRKTIFIGSSSLESSPAAISALTFKICPSTDSARLVRMGRAPALMDASSGRLSTRVILPTRPYFSSSRKSAVNTPEVIGRARVPSFSRAPTSLRFSSRKTRRATWSVFASGFFEREQLNFYIYICIKLLSARHTCYPNPIDVVWNDSLSLDDLVKLWSPTMKHNWVQAHAIEEAQAKR